MYKWGLAALTLLLVTLGAPPAVADVPIPAGSAGDDIIFNFNFVSPPASLPPPYTRVEVPISVYNGSGSLDQITLDLFGALNGSDLLNAFSLTLNGGLSAYMLNVPCEISPSAEALAVCDGIFSVGLHVLTGPAALVGSAITATGIAGTAGSVSIAGVLATGAVPEPATLTLFGIGLAGIGVARRRLRKQARLATTQEALCRVFPVEAWRPRPERQDCISSGPGIA